MNPVDEFLKTAGWLNAFRVGLNAGGPRRTLGEAVMHGAGQGLPTAIVGMALAGAAAGGAKGIGHLRNRMSKTRDYNSMLKANPAVKKYDSGQVQMVFNSLRAQAPTMSKDPLIANSFVRRTLDMAPEDGPYIDVATAKTLAETQRNIAQSKDGRGGIGESLRPMQMFPTNRDPFDTQGRNMQADLLPKRQQLDVRKLKMQGAQAAESKRQFQESFKQRQKHHEERAYP